MPKVCTLSNWHLRRLVNLTENNRILITYKFHTTTATFFKQILRQTAELNDLPIHLDIVSYFIKPINKKAFQPKAKHPLSADSERKDPRMVRSP